MLAFFFGEMNMDSEGSLNFKVTTDFYVDSDGIADILPKEERNLLSAEESFKMSKEILLDQVASLLGDEVTSDEIVSVRTTEDAEIGSFFCHSSILSGKFKGYDGHEVC